MKGTEMFENVSIKELMPCVLLIENAIDNPQEVIDFALKQNEGKELKNARIYNVNGEQEIQKFNRNTQMIDIHPIYSNNVFWWILAQKIWKYGDSYGKKYNIGFSRMEDPQFLWYKKNEGFYNPHMDSGIISRIFSAVLYLNDVEEGGETHFEHFNISVKPNAGSLLLFPSDFSYLHGAKTPISNDKFAIVTWFNP